MRWTPHITVAAIVPRNDQFLMVSEYESGQLVINQPAGHVESNETLTEAVLREVREETAWVVEPLHIVGIYRYQANADAIEYLRVCYACTPIEKTDDVLDPDIESADWLTLDDIRSRPHRSALVKRCLEDYLSHQQAPLQFISWEGAP